MRWILAGHVVVAVVTVGLICSRSAADDDAPVCSLRTDGPRVLADCSGALHEIAIHYVPDFAVELEPTYDDLFSALPVDVHVQVICSSREAADVFNERWGYEQRGRGRCVKVINVDRPITVWARDRRIARVCGSDGVPAAALVPRDHSSYGDDHRNDLVVSYLLEYGGICPRPEDASLQIEGGNVVANNRHVFVGANVIKDNQALGREPAAVKRELLAMLGRPCVLVGDDDQHAPWCHADMYITPIDDSTILVASTAVADMLLSSNARLVEELGDLFEPGDSLSHLTKRGHRFDAVAAQLGEYGYSIIRLPALADPGEERMVTYNNVLLEERDGRSIVYMPTYDLPALDQAAEAVYRSLGFEVRHIDVSQMFQHGGAVRCLVNVLSRDPPNNVLADASAASVPLVPPVPPVPTTVEPAPGSPEDGAVVAGAAQWFPFVASIWLPLFIFCARITDVSIGTVRLICITRGRKTLAISLAVAEVTVWLLAVASVITHLDNWFNIIAYVGGFTAGNAVGMWIEQRLALGVETVILISQQKGAQIATALRDVQLRLTTFVGSGRDGPVEMCLAFVPRRLTPIVLGLARAIDPEVVATVEDVRHTSIKWAGGGGTGVVLPPRGRRFPWLPRTETTTNTADGADQAA